MNSVDSRWRLKLLLCSVITLILFSHILIFELGITDNISVLKDTNKDDLFRYLYIGNNLSRGNWQQFQGLISVMRSSHTGFDKKYSRELPNELDSMLKSTFINEEFYKIKFENSRRVRRFQRLIKTLDEDAIKWNEKRNNGKFVTIPTITATKTVQSMPTCVVNKTKLHGREKVNRDYHGYNYLEKLFKDTEIGGRWRPKDCKPSKKVAIILPFRDRDVHLKQLLHNLIPKLRRQKVDYTFYLIEQGQGSNFNRGMMRNVGYVEASKDGDYDCYIFNDVDTVIENDLNTYTCRDNAVLHMGAAIDIFNYTLPYHSLIGGILSFPKNLFSRINGYSNFYFIWGAEDDDMWRRIHRVKGGRVVRPRIDLTKITTLEHERDPKVWERVTMYHAVSPFIDKDGLNTLNYTRMFIEKRKLFTWVYVKVNETHYHELFEKYKKERRLKAMKTTTIPPDDETTETKAHGDEKTQTTPTP